MKPPIGNKFYEQHIQGCKECQQNHIENVFNVCDKLDKEVVNGLNKIISFYKRENELYHDLVNDVDVPEAYKYFYRQLIILNEDLIEICLGDVGEINETK